MFSPLVDELLAKEVLRERERQIQARLKHHAVKVDENAPEGERSFMTWQKDGRGMRLRWRIHRAKPSLSQP